MHRKETYVLIKNEEIFFGMADNLVIFDCDGVLVDSEMISSRLLRELLREFDVEIDDAFIFQNFLGKSVRTVASMMRRMFDIDVPFSRFEQMRADILDVFENDLMPVPSIDAALSSIGEAKCVASSSYKDRVVRSLQLTNIDHHFDAHVFSATMVKRGKPFPDLFIYAAEQMGFDASQCIVVEDSAAGIEAAKAANMKTIGFTGGLHGQVGDLHNQLSVLAPDRIITHMQDLGCALDALRA